MITKDIVTKGYEIKDIVTKGYDDKRIVTCLLYTSDAADE